MDEEEDNEEIPYAYDQVFFLTVNAFSTDEAVERALDKAGDLDFSRLPQEKAGFDEVVSLTPSNYARTPGAQSVELVLVRRAYLGNGHSVSDAEYFLTDIQGGQPLSEQPDLPDSPAMVAYRSSLARQEHLEAVLPSASETTAEEDLACGQWLTDALGLDWSATHGVWTWDRRPSPLHCKTLVAMCERPTQEEAMQRLGELARAMMDDPDLPHLIDRQCVPVLRNGWEQANKVWREQQLNQSLPTPSRAGRKPRF